MDFKQQLAEIKRRVDGEIAKHFDRTIKGAKKDDLLLAQALEHAKKIVLSGGKRLRPAMLVWGYRAGGGRNEKAIFQIAAAIELVHIFFLIHDDIIDKGDKRHGIETLHIEFAKRAKKEKLSKHPERFGESIAIIVGDMVYAMAMEIILKSNADSEIKSKALEYLQKIVQTTIIGQSQDIQIENAKKVSQEQVLEMYKNKTARYTFVGPLQLGMILSGNNDVALQKACSKYAMALGIAFQIQDDILGIFGNDKLTGKSKKSDLAEGKRSILIVHALENANVAQLKTLNSVLGNRLAKETNIKQVKKTLQEIGSLKYAQKNAFEYLSKGYDTMKKIRISKESKQFFLGIIEFLKNREV